MNESQRRGAVQVFPVLEIRGDDSVDQARHVVHGVSQPELEGGGQLVQLFLDGCFDRVGDVRDLDMHAQDVFVDGDGRLDEDFARFQVANKALAKVKALRVALRFQGNGDILDAAAGVRVVEQRDGGNSDHRLRLDKQREGEGDVGVLQIANSFFRFKVCPLAHPGDQILDLFANSLLLCGILCYLGVNY